METIKKFWEDHKDKIIIVIGTILSFQIFDMALSSHNPYTAFLASATGIFGMVGLWWVIDRFALKGFDTLTELKNGNIAVAIAFAGIFISFAIIYVGSTGVFR